MKPHIPLYLAPEQRAFLEQLLHAGRAPARTQTRARILLQKTQRFRHLNDRSQGLGHTDEQVAAMLVCSKSTVANVRHRFLQEGMKELRDTPQGTLPMSPGQPARED